MESYTFDKQSTERIGTTVRRVEGMPRVQTGASMSDAPLVPFQIQRFRLTGTWSGLSAEANRVYWDGSAYAVDASKTYTVHSFLEPWDTYFNQGSPSNPLDYVIAYHRHDCDRWEVLNFNQNHTMPAKCQEDWQLPSTWTRPHVGIKLLSDNLSTEISAQFDAIIDVAWDATYLSKPAPELFSGDYCSVTITSWGDVIVTSPLAFSFLGELRHWTGSATNIPDGWVLANGAALPASKKVTATNSPNLKGRFIMGIDPNDAAGDSSENTIGDVGGFRWHGVEENNHLNHDNHRHALDAATYTTAQVATGTDETVITNDTTPYTSGATNLSGGGTDILNHLGGDGPSSDSTDNRPRFYVSAILYRYK